MGFTAGSAVKNLLANAGDAGDTGLISLGQEDALEEEMATPSSILACEIPWIEQLGELQSKGLKESGTTEHTYTCKSHMIYLSFLYVIFIMLYFHKYFNDYAIILNIYSNKLY